MSENVVTSSELTIVILLWDKNSTKVVFQILNSQNSSTHSMKGNRVFRNRSFEFSFYCIPVPF